MAEERLRTMASLRGTPAITLSAWRGRSGRRYVVGVHDMEEPDLLEMGDAVVIAVRRDGSGVAQPVCVATSGESPRERLKRGWLAHVARRGATEMHVHRLAQTESERRAVLEDLGHPGVGSELIGRSPLWAAIGLPPLRRQGSCRQRRPAREVRAEPRDHDGAGI